MDKSVRKPTDIEEISRQQKKILGCLERLAREESIDVAYAVSRLNGKQEVYLRLLWQLADVHRHDLDRISAALAQGDRAGAYLIANALKGVSSSLWIPGLAETPRKLCDHFEQAPGPNDAWHLDGLIAEASLRLSSFVALMENCHPDDPQAH